MGCVWSGTDSSATSRRSLASPPFEPLREPAGDYLTVDMTGDVELAADEVLGYIEEAAQ